jgi:cell division protein DivIC
MVDLKRIWLKYRFLIIFSLFLLWVTFFDSNSVYSLWVIKREYQVLQKESRFFKQEIEKAKEKRDFLFSDLNNLEQFAREQYFMKRPDEDVFIIEFEGQK